MNRHVSVRIFLLVAGFAAMSASTGCKDKSGPKLVAVEGRVFFDNKPLPTGFVTFHPDASKGNNSQEQPLSEIDAEGNYKILTRVRPGAAPGWYKVTVSAADQLDPKNPYFTKWLIPDKYIDPEKSKLAVEVVENPAPGAYDLKLQRK